MQRLVWLFFVGFLSFPALATPSPITQLESTANTIISQLQANRTQLQSNPDVAYNIVNRYLVPEVDVGIMARKALGPDAWRSATAAQRDTFTREFQRLVVRTYSKAIAQFSNESVRFEPIRGGYQNKRRVQVNSRILRPSGPPIQVNYQVYLAGSRWRVYDISIEGISILRSYRSQFSQELRQGNLDRLNQKLIALNRKN